MDKIKLPKSEIRKVEIVHVDCQQCGYKGITYYLAGDTYGILLGNTSDNQLAVFDTWKDSAFFEDLSCYYDKLMADPTPQKWSDRFINYFGISKAIDPNLTDCFHKIIGLVCDPSPSGLNYGFSGKHFCPQCKSIGPHLILDDPIEFDHINLKNISHRKWDQLSSEEKSLFLKEKLYEIGCLSDTQERKIFPIDISSLRNLFNIRKVG